MAKRQQIGTFPADGIDAAVASFIADVVELAGRFRRVADNIARQEGQTQARWYALSVFSENPLTVSRAARRLGTTRQAVQRSADELIAQGLAIAEPNPDHRTSPFITLTPRGADVLSRISHAAMRSRQHWLADPDTNELEAAHTVVRNLLDALRDQP